MREYLSLTRWSLLLSEECRRLLVGCTVIVLLLGIFPVFSLAEQALEEAISENAAVEVAEPEASESEVNQLITPQVEAELDASGNATLSTQPSTPNAYGFPLPPFILLQPYKGRFAELDLTRIEATHFLRGPVVLSPDFQVATYTEVVYQPGPQQVSSQLYTQPLDDLPAYDAQAVVSNPMLANPKRWLAVLDPYQAMQRRDLIWRVGDKGTRPFGFQTLTIVDWSASGAYLLLKRKVGVLYTGLKTSDPLVMERATGKLRQYSDIKRALSYYWHKKLPPEDKLFTAAWELQPIGWEPGSDTRFYLEGWAYHANKKSRYLGLWVFDLSNNQPRLLSETPRTVPLASNGKIALLEVTTIPEPYRQDYLPAAAKTTPSQPSAGPRWWKPWSWKKPPFIRHRFQQKESGAS